MRKKIGECLIQAGLITDDGLRNALAERRKTGERLGVVLARLNLASETQIAEAVAQQLGFPFISLGDNPAHPTAVALIDKAVALKHVCIGVSLDKNILTVAMAEPLLFSLVHELESKTGCRIAQVVATRADIIDAIETGYPDTPPARAPRTSGVDNHKEGIETLVDRVVQSAIASSASDVHIEPAEDRVVIRHRLDGVLKQVMDLPKSVHAPLIARIKTMSGMDVAEKRLPQDGRLSVRSGAVPANFRVLTLQTLHGEKVVMRVLEPRKVAPVLDQFGMSAAALERMRHLLRHQHGVLLVAGPTGSGKTTTLSAALAALAAMKSETTNIVTIENPIEYEIGGVNQTQIDDDDPAAFAGRLRAILGQDPDAVALGELPDGETLNIAVNAAQSGRFVLSTLPADDAPSCVTRLVHMGAEPFAVASALVGVVAQRVVRRLCVHCRREHTPAVDVLQSLGITAADAAANTFYEAVGCDQCNHTGFRGRIGIFEVMRITDDLRGLIAAKAPAAQIRGEAIAGGMITLGEDGLSKVRTGVTTAEELRRVLTALHDARTLCGACGTAVEADFKACPHCGQRLGNACPHCGRALQPGWNFCPYCARSIEAPSAPRRPKSVLPQRQTGA